MNLLVMELQALLSGEGSVARILNTSGN